MRIVRSPPLQVGAATSPPNPTTEITLGINLDPNEPVAVNPFDPADPEATAAFSTSVPMYDSLGNAHDVEVYFVHTGPGSWDWHAQIDGGDIEGVLDLLCEAGRVYYVAVELDRTRMGHPELSLLSEADGMKLLRAQTPAQVQESAP